jgi:hypothetical protein
MHKTPVSVRSILRIRLDRQLLFLHACPLVITAKYRARDDWVYACAVIHDCRNLCMFSDKYKCCIMLWGLEVTE